MLPVYYRILMLTQSHFSSFWAPMWIFEVSWVYNFPAKVFNCWWENLQASFFSALLRLYVPDYAWDRVSVWRTVAMESHLEPQLTV